MREIQLLETKSGILSLKINGVYVYSKYDPLKEVGRFWDNNKEYYLDKKGIVIYGLGLGYHVMELLNRVDENFEVFIFDIDEECYGFTKNFKSIKNLHKKKNVNVKIGKSKENLMLMSEKILKYYNFLMIEGVFRTLDDEHIEFKNVINEFKVSKKSIDKFGDQMRKCEIINKGIDYLDIDIFIQRYVGIKKPIVLVSSGPSLDDEVFKNLRQYRESIIIFSVGRSLRSLIDNGIYPDMFCIIDCQDLVYEHIKGLEGLQIPMAFLNTANSLTVKMYDGPKYMFYNEDIGQKYVIDTGKSVSTAILDIAIKCLPRKIIFVGQDLAYTDGESHSEYSKYSYDSGINNGRYINQVESVEGKLIPTTEGLKSFKRWIERKIRANSGVEYFNYSRGANIEGTKIIGESDFIDLFE